MESLSDHSNHHPHLRPLPLLRRRLELRFTKHSKEKPWWPQVTTIKIEHYATADAAAEAEKKAIKAERPLWNVAHTDKPRQPRPHVTARVVQGDTFVGVGEAARLLGVSEGTVRNMADEGELRARRLSAGRRTGPRQIALASIKECIAEAEERASRTAS
ncbi:DNA-binding protein [Micromonospora sp. 15K316]|uniref:helix-turn-helix domain-containing protein n=1 Tax=Micromonospora sp. 15K316 TaxID=2530376 RepID=UPI001050C139|nr:helix-turn-helix domain-containing protein [Micromonospora sp. 15K316]TDC26882.1 DNA-binding protein [Micromonospora sp. 15K316]